MSVKPPPPSSAVAHGLLVFGLCKSISLFRRRTAKVRPATRYVTRQGIISGGQVIKMHFGAVHCHAAKPLLLGVLAE